MGKDGNESKRARQSRAEDVSTAANTPCFHDAVVEVAVPGSVPLDDGGIHNCQQG